MSSSVDVSDRTKRRLEQLQAAVEETTDREVSQRELLDQLVRERYDSKEAFVASFRDEGGSDSDDWDGLSEEERETFFSGTFASGTETGEEAIDDILYE